MPTFLLNHLRALTLGPTQAAMLEGWLDTDPTSAGESLVEALRATLAPPEGRLKVKYCCESGMVTRGSVHDKWCEGPVPVEK